MASARAGRGWVGLWEWAGDEGPCGQGGRSRRKEEALTSCGAPPVYGVLSVRRVVFVLQHKCTAWARTTQEPRGVEDDSGRGPMGAGRV